MEIFERKGFATQNGLGMLVNQAAEAFKLWFGINLTSEDIIEAKELCEKPIKVAITGKIGSGKTMICNYLKKEGFKVFESDYEVRKL